MHQSKTPQDYFAEDLKHIINTNEFAQTYLYKLHDYDEYQEIVAVVNSNSITDNKEHSELVDGTQSIHIEQMYLDVIGDLKVGDNFYLGTFVFTCLEITYELGKIKIVASEITSR